jgi:Flp pilus assembly protein TadD
MIRGRWDEAILAFQRSAELDPSNAAAYRQLANCLAMKGQWDEAIRNVETSMRLNPRDPFRHECFLVFSRARFAAGCYEDAVKWAQQSVRSQSMNPGAYGALAASYAHLGLRGEAQGAMKSLRELVPSSSVAAIQRRLAPSYDRAYVDRMIDGLRKAGLPGE